MPFKDNQNLIEKKKKISRTPFYTRTNSENEFSIALLIDHRNFHCSIDFHAEREREGERERVKLYHTIDDFHPWKMRNFPSNISELN